MSFGRSGVVKMSCASYGGEERNLRGLSGGALVSSYICLFQGPFRGCTCLKCTNVADSVISVVGLGCAM